MTTPDDDLIERVATRLLNVLLKQYGRGPSTLAELRPEHRVGWMEAALAAIEEMQEFVEEGVIESAKLLCRLYNDAPYDDLPEVADVVAISNATVTRPIYDQRQALADASAVIECVFDAALNPAPAKPDGDA